MSEQPIELDPNVDDHPEYAEHPERLDDVEAMRGHAMWQAVEDTDDDSNGLDPA